MTDVTPPGEDFQDSTLRWKQEAVLLKAQRDAYILRVDDLLSLLDAARALRTGPPTPRKFQALDEAIVRADAVSVMAERPDIDRLADTVRTGIRPFDYDDTPWNNGDVQDALDELVALAHDTAETLKHADRLADDVEAAETRIAELEQDRASMAGTLQAALRTAEASERRVAELERERDEWKGSCLRERYALAHERERVAELEAALRKAWDQLKELAGLVEDGGCA